MLFLGRFDPVIPRSFHTTFRWAVSLGGEAFEGEWANPIFKVSNIAVREGSHIQIREFKNASSGS